MWAHALDRVARRERGRILAALIRWCGSFQLAEDALQDALLTAAERWPEDGVPERPGAWLTQAARRRVLDRLRRKQTAEAHQRALELEPDFPESLELEAHLPDERLRLIFTCCHPSLAPEDRVALTLRTVGEMSTLEVARAFLVKEKTMAQRLVRAKRRLAEVSFEVPGPRSFPARLGDVLQTLYLIYNAGYLAESGARLMRDELCAEARRLSRALQSLLPEAAEVEALWALMLLHDSRAPARELDGDLVLLEDQDRGLWDDALRREGLARVESALERGPVGRYQLEAAIAAVHAEAKTHAETDWRQIAELYRLLERFAPNPVVSLHRAIAIGLADGPAAGLAQLAALEASAALDRYLALPLARADMLGRLDRPTEALAALDRALELADSAVVRRALERRRQHLLRETDDGE